MTKIIYFDICACLIICPVIVAMIRRHMLHGITNKWFFMFAGTALFTACADVAAVGLDIAGPGNVMLKYIAHTLYLLGRNYATPVCIAFLFARTGLWYRYGNYKKSVLIFLSPSFIPTAIILLVNPFYHGLFFIDESGTYTRGPLMSTMYIVSMLYAVLGYYLLIKYRKLLGNRKVINLLLVFSSILMATIFQFFFPSIIIECFSLSLATVVIALSVQIPEERLYGRTSFLKVSSFSEDTAFSKRLEVGFNIVMVCITNFDSLKEMLSYNAFNKCLSDMDYNLCAYRRKVKKDLEFYYCGRGQFAITQRDNATYEDAQSVADYVKSILTDGIKIDDIEIRILANICIGRFPDDISNDKDILPFMSQLSKMDFTGEIRYARDIFDKKEYEIRRNIEAIINRALEKGDMNFEYQPIYSVEKERYIAAEAFLRLKDPFYGDIPPAFVIEEAERCGAIHGITTFLFEELCKFVSGPEFMQLNFERIEMNLSPIQCMWGDLPTILMSTMEAYGVNPNNICFNIVDTGDSEQYQRMEDSIQKITETGIAVYMDDFGAGVFEVERVARLPLAGIKLDRDFIRMGIEEDAILVLENSVRMIRDMEMDVVAVGVENLSMRRRLVEMGCMNQQGYYYAKPMGKRELIRSSIGLPGAFL